MRRLLGWLAGLAGVAALAKILHGRRHAEPDGVPSDDALGETDPAAELRRKLDEVRASGATDDAAEPAEHGADDPTGPTLEERRAAIHAKAQEAIDAMRGGEQ